MTPTSVAALADTAEEFVASCFVCGACGDGEVDRADGYFYCVMCVGLFFIAQRDDVVYWYLIQ